MLSASEIGNYPIRNFSINEIGTIGTSALIQDDFGNIILGSEDGLFVLKANRWETYYDFARPIMKLCLDEEGRINIGGPDYFGYFRLDSTGNEEFEELGKFLPDSLSFRQVNHIVSSDAGTFFHLDNRLVRVNENIVDFGTMLV